MLSFFAVCVLIGVFVMFLIAIGGNNQLFYEPVPAQPADVTVEGTMQ